MLNRDSLPHFPLPTPPGKGGTPKSVPACPSLRLSSCGCQQGASIPERTKKKGGKDGGADGQEVGLPPLPVNLPDASEERRRRSAVDQASLSSLVVGQLFFFIWICSIYIDMLCFVLMHKHTLSQKFLRNTGFRRLRETKPLQDAGLRSSRSIKLPQDAGFRSLIATKLLQEAGFRS